MLVVCKCIHINKLVDVTNGIYTDLNLESEFKKLNSSILKVHTDNVSIYCIQLKYRVDN